MSLEFKEGVWTEDKNLEAFMYILLNAMRLDDIVGWMLIEKA
mgnify:CR=1 FL=1